MRCYPQSGTLQSSIVKHPLIVSSRNQLPVEKMNHHINRIQHLLQPPICLRPSQPRSPVHHQSQKAQIYLIHHNARIILQPHPLQLHRILLDILATQLRNTHMQRARRRRPARERAQDRPVQRHQEQQPEEYDGPGPARRTAVAARALDHGQEVHADEDCADDGARPSVAEDDGTPGGF